MLGELVHCFRRCFRAASDKKTKFPTVFCVGGGFKRQYSQSYNFA